MWAPRRVFWLDLYRDGHIQEAWVALSDEGRRIADRRAREARDNTLLCFGRQTVGGARANTSLLILRVNRRIVVEGSHNYKVHVFRPGEPGCPSLYLNAYDCESVRESQPGHEARSHIGDWQAWVRQRVT